MFELIYYFSVGCSLKSMLHCTMVALELPVQVFEVRSTPFGMYLARPYHLSPAGIPTLIKPWFGDQYFWASRVQHLGVRTLPFFVNHLSLTRGSSQAGLRVLSLRVSDLSHALIKATSDR